MLVENHDDGCHGKMIMCTLYAGSELASWYVVFKVRTDYDHHHHPYHPHQYHNQLHHGDHHHLYDNRHPRLQSVYSTWPTLPTPGTSMWVQFVFEISLITIKVIVIVIKVFYVDSSNHTHIRHNKISPPAHRPWWHSKCMEVSLPETSVEFFLDKITK